MNDFDFEGFWKHSDYADETYVEAPVTTNTVAEVERRLGYRLPAAYVALMTSQNGGTPKRTVHRTKERTTWAKDHIAITGIFGIGDEKRLTLCGMNGNPFWQEDWGYPDIGVYFANCPSGGHDMLCLDYRACGPQGEPCVVHVDEEWDYKITFVAPTFEAFVRGLEDAAVFDVD